MNKQYLKGICFLLLCLGSHLGFAQVSGISYTLSPTVENVWWDDQAGIEDGLLFGGKFGLGFGEYLELRANYMESGDLKTSFTDYGLANFNDSLFTARDVKIKRWGGDLKANLSKGALLPFVTLGTGIQSIGLDTMEATKQIYVQVGGGVKFSLGDRSTLMIEGKNTRYNYNPAQNLLTDEDRADLGVVEDDIEVKELRNWSLAASVQFYLGGRRPGTLSDLDKAYFRTFTDGLQGVRTPFEPTIARVNFHKDLGFRNTWMAGGSLGFDFNPYVGLRGFYLQGVNDGPISTDFDKLSIYGGELRLNLNAAGSGLTPYLIAGGGNIRAADDYVGRDSMRIDNQAFAMGGAGVILPFSNRLKVFGNVRAMLTSNTAIEDLQQTDDLQESWMTSFGVNLTLGKKAKSGNAFQLDMMEASKEEQRIANEIEQKALKEKYETQILELETKLNEAYAQKDIDEAAAILKEKEFAEQVVEEIEKQEVEKEQKEQMQQIQQQQQPSSIMLSPNTNGGSGSIIQMSPAEFENLIDEILDHRDRNDSRTVPAPVATSESFKQADVQAMMQQQELNRRIAEMEKMITEMKSNNSNNAAADKSLSQADVEAMMQKQELNRRIVEMEKMLNQVEAQQQQAQAPTPNSNTDSDGANMIQKDLMEVSTKLLMEIQKLSEKVDENQKSIEKMQKKDNKSGASDDGDTGYNIPNKTIDELNIQTTGEFVQARDSSFADKMSYEGMSSFAGFNVGGQTTFNVGFRWHYAIEDSPFELMPETFFGFGSPSSFGIAMNGVLPINIKNTFAEPYVSLGAGFMQIAEDGDDRVRFNYNFIFGTYLNVAGGRIYADFTARNAFKYNQIVVGYRLPF